MPSYTGVQFVLLTVYQYVGTMSLTLSSSAAVNAVNIFFSVFLTEDMCVNETKVSSKYHNCIVKTSVLVSIQVFSFHIVQCEAVVFTTP